MEIEKARETSWRIQLKNQNEIIEITSVEISGEVRKIRLKLIKADENITIELNKEEFFNFLSLITAFKDVVIGEEQILFTQDYLKSEEAHINVENNENNSFEESNLDKTLNSMNDAKTEDLNPEEWDPW